MQKLISILTATYNYGHFIHRLLDSILQQTYNNIEMVVIDDGSTDNTEQVIEKYMDKFNKRGYRLNYSYQENQKLAMAINNGLKLITGDYLVWPDADDWYAEPNALEIMAATLDGTGDEISCCRGLAYFVDENFNEIGKTRHNAPGQLFMDCLLTNFVFTPGFTMVKTGILFHEIDNRTIYTGSADKKHFGQNWQILLPVFYSYKCIFIHKCLFNIFVNTNSDSRKKNSYEGQLEKNEMSCDALESILKNMKNMPDKEKEDLLRRVKTRHNRYELILHFYYTKKKEVRRVYKQMIVKNMLITKKVKIIYGLSFIPFAYTLCKILRMCKK